MIGTPATINSNAYARAIHDYAPDSRIHSQACALFVPLVAVLLWPLWPEPQGDRVVPVIGAMLFAALMVDHYLAIVPG